MSLPFGCAPKLFILTIILASAPATLRDAATSSRVLIGTAVRPSLFSETAYSATLSREFNLVEPEDVMKWSTIRHDKKSFDFREGDHVVQFAEAHEMKIRACCLVWDHSNSDWLANGNFTPAQLSTLLKDHISSVMKHYAGHVFAWDVVNEGLNEDGNPKNSIWFNKPGIGLSQKGTAYIEQVFRWAHEADPHALLFYNDNGGESLGQKSDAVFAMLKVFKQRGVPIDGVGLQMHIFELNFDASAVAANIARLTALGLQIHITELDVSLPVDSGGQARTEDVNRQADIYRNVVRVCLKNPGCTAIQTWGFTDKYSWIGSHSRHSRGAALPFDQAYQPKAAYHAMLTELASGRKPTH